MKLTARRTTTAIAAVATAGVSSLFMGVAPASAATSECGTDGTLVAPGICEQTFTDSGTFTHTTSMTKLEVLLVGAGGAGTSQTSNGYAAGGGGGEVRIVDFSAATDDLVITVPASNVDPTEVASGALDETANAGANGTAANSTGGASGNGNIGSTGSGNPSNIGSGGGAGGAANNVTKKDGGPGLVVSAIVAADPALSGSLFTDDTLCYGGGGATGAAEVPAVPAVPGDTTVTPPIAASPAVPAVPAIVGVAGCNAGGPDADSTALNSPLAGYGGGGGAISGVNDPESQSGASGVVVVRWAVPKPALAATGLTLSPVEVGVAGGTLLAGALLAFAAFRRRREAE